MIDIQKKKNSLQQIIKNKLKFGLKNVLLVF